MKLSSLAAVGSAVSMLASCGGVDLWPFGPRDQGVPGAPPNATEYRCEGDRPLYIRFVNDNASAWVILPEREFRLDRDTAAAGTRYRAGATVLEVSGEQLSLADGAKLSYVGCRMAGRT